MQRGVRKVIALDEGDVLGVVREHARGQQACSAASQNDGVSEAFFYHELGPPGAQFSSVTERTSRQPLPSAARSAFRNSSGCSMGGSSAASSITCSGHP